jgi:Family of unknown function (DUF5362)
MRVLGAILIVIGLICCLTIIGAIFGIPMILIGIVLVALGGRRKTVINNVVTVSNSPHLGSAPLQDPAPQIRFKELPRLTNRNDAALNRESSVIDAVPVAVSQQTSSDQFFNALEELTLRASAILESARKDGYAVDIRNEGVTVTRAGRAPITLQSNSEVLAFGKFAGF